MGKVLNIFGLLSNLGGVVLLFLFGMPFRVATGAGRPTKRDQRRLVALKATDGDDFS